MSTLVGVNLSHLLIVYDIACQWQKHLRARLSDLRTNIDVDLNNVEITVAIPKAHIKAHGKTCQSPFSLNYLPGSGRTDGEGVERDWAHMNALTASTREMGPGNRHETFDDHWGSWNWQKIIRLGTYFNIIYIFQYIDTSRCFPPSKAARCDRQSCRTTSALFGTIRSMLRVGIARVRIAGVRIDGVRIARVDITEDSSLGYSDSAMGR
jgi:hypothetical protein